MNERLISFIENSFISPLLSDSEITDISYNGISLFYMHNKKGRLKAEFEISEEDASNFLRQIANLSERQFSYSSPELNVTAGKYRINGVHSSVVRVRDDKAVSFSIRIASDELRIKNDGAFMSKEINDFLIDSLNKNKSIVIGGSVGAGKTELQKYLISSFKENTRAIIIDDIQELDYLKRNENLDITCWQISPYNQNASISELVRIALRSNPDWLIIAESRGEEMNELLNSVMTGHPIITTIHVHNLLDMPIKMARMVESSKTSESHDDILYDIYANFDVFIYLERESNKDGSISRYVSGVGISENGKIKVIYERKSKK